MNVLTHALGVLLSVTGLVLLLNTAITGGETVQIISFGVYGASLVILYVASTLYHSAIEPLRRARLKVVDHAAIYVLIAGTYTPYMLVTLQTPLSYSVLTGVWLFAAAGIIFKIFFVGKFERLSTIAYLAMGWAAVIVLKPLIEELAENGIRWLMAGGIAYTVGAVLYLLKRIPYNHAIFHVFVLLGSFFHYMSVYHYVIPKS